MYIYGLRRNNQHFLTLSSTTPDEVIHDIIIDSSF